MIRFARLVLWSAVLLALSVVGLVIFLRVRHSRAVILPTPTGPYGVGRMEYDWVDTSRVDTFAAPARQKRKLPVWIWYPADPSAKGEPAPYLPPAWLRARADRGLGTFLTRNLAAVYSHAHHHVSLSAQQRRYPVLVMQPGLGPLLADYTALAEELASRGYIVVGSTPPYSASVVAFRDGQVVRGTSAGNVPDTATPTEAKRVLGQLIKVWAADDRFILDQLTRLNLASPNTIFTGRLDLRAIGLLGHSFGGATAAEVCHLDARCKAGVDLDGYPYGDVVQTGLKQPFMFVWSEPEPRDAGWQQAMRDVRAIYTRLKHGGYQLTIRGTRHFNFSDYALMFSPVLKMQGGMGTIDGQRGLTITEDYVRAFFDTYLKHTYLKHLKAPLLTGSVTRYPEVKLESR